MWILLVSVSAYRFTGSVSGLSDSFGSEEVLLAGDLYNGVYISTPKITYPDLSRLNKFDFKYTFAPQWLKDFHVSIVIPGGLSLKSYATIIESRNIFKESLRIFPFHFFF